MGHSEDGYQGFYLFPSLHTIIILQDFLNQWNKFFPLLDHFLHCPCDLSMEYFDAHSFTVSTMELIASLVLNHMLCLLGSRHLFTIVLSWAGFPSLKNVPLFWVLPTKFQKSFLLSHLKKKHYETHCMWNNKSRGWQ